MFYFDNVISAIAQREHPSHHDRHKLSLIRFMGRENGEDYRSDFLTMLNTWEGAMRFSGAAAPENRKPIDIAALLGLTHPRRRHRALFAARDGTSTTSSTGGLCRVAAPPVLSAFLNWPSRPPILICGRK
jgi:hypothetical protein